MLEEVSMDRVLSTAIVATAQGGDTGHALPVQRRARDIVRECLAWTPDWAKYPIDPADSFANVWLAAIEARAVFAERHPEIDDAALDSLRNRWAYGWR